MDSSKSHAFSALPPHPQYKRGKGGGSGGVKETVTTSAPPSGSKDVTAATPWTLPCSPPSRRWVSPLDRRCPQRPHSRRALHPEPAAAGAAAGAGAAVAAPGRLRQPPGSGGWAPGAEKLPPHPSPSSHSLEGKTKAERRLGSGARRLLSGPWHAWLAEEGPPRARPPSCHPSPALPAARLRRCGASGPVSRRGAGGRVSLERWPSGAPRQSRYTERILTVAGRLPAARPSQPWGQPQGLVLLILDPGSAILDHLASPRAPWVFHRPSNLLNKVTGRTNQMGSLCLATLAGKENVRCQWNLAPPAADQAPTLSVAPFPAQRNRKREGVLTYA